MTAAGTAGAKWGDGGSDNDVTPGDHDGGRDSEGEVGSAKVTTHHDGGRNGADEVRGGAVDDNVTQVTMTAAATVRTE